MIRRLSFLIPVLALGVANALTIPAEGRDKQAVENAKRDRPRTDIVRNAVAHDERVWRALEKPQPPADLGSRDLFAYALALCEAGEHPERLERLFDVAARMQDRDPDSRACGNFRWSYGHEGVFDFNAVDFCMQNAAPLWLRHRATMPAGAREKLRELIGFGVEGLLRHRVRESYTNIALMNAGDLILLGEALGSADAAEEGYLRLEAVCLNIWEGGVHEYVSPTYYGTDLDDLILIEAFCRRERGRAQARALLELFWTDIALNWFAPAERLAGARSRDYDYLHGLGYLDQQLMANGWLAATQKRKIIAIQTAFAKWRPLEKLKTLSEGRFPREVRQSWGPGPDQTRTHFLHRDVTLSAAGASYGSRMDLPLTVDLPGPRESVRCYLIPDGRHDPYGKSKISDGKAHAKTFHLDPFFAGAQRRDDALGLVIYRDKDLPEQVETLETHFVLPLDVDGFWIGARRVELARGKAAEFPLQPGEALCLRKGTAAVGIRVPWGRGLDGQEAAVSLVADANPYGAVRLTVTHHAASKPAGAPPQAGAAFWVRVGSDLGTDEAFQQWRRAFAAPVPDVQASADRVLVRAAGKEGVVLIEAAAPFAKTAAVEPPPPPAILELDGEDIGRRLLRNVEPMKTYRLFLAGAPVPVGADRGTHWEAEAGHVVARMVVGEDSSASGGKFVWMPTQAGAAEGRGGPGHVTFLLKVAQAGKYYVWGRVLAPTPKADSFTVRVLKGPAEVLHDATWATGVHRQWEWTRLALDKARAPLPLSLPEGEVRLQLRVREDGTRIDCLFITPDARDVPK